MGRYAALALGAWINTGTSPMGANLAQTQRGGMRRVNGHAASAARAFGYDYGQWYAHADRVAWWCLFPDAGDGGAA